MKQFMVCDIGGCNVYKEIELHPLYDKLSGYEEHKLQQFIQTAKKGEHIYLQDSNITIIRTRNTPKLQSTTKSEKILSDLNSMIKDITNSIKDIRL